MQIVYLLWEHDWAEYTPTILCIYKDKEHAEQVMAEMMSTPNRNKNYRYFITTEEVI